MLWQGSDGFSMSIIKNFSDSISSYLGMNNDIFYIIVASSLTFVFFALLRRVTNKIINSTVYDDRKKYNINQSIKLIFTIIKYAILLFIWDSYIKSLMTLISFISAALTIALRDIIFNWFAGIYIKFRKIFEIEDRISINNITGDVVNIKGLHFELLEVSDKEHGEQSTGIMVTVPNSHIFTKELKNYNKAFKYIWDELKINVELTSSIEATKGYIYEILKQDKIVRPIPKKVARQINEVNVDYRIYYNNLDPIIYTKIVGKYIELSIRYLVHPKKARIVKDELSLKILELYKEKKVLLHHE